MYNKAKYALDEVGSIVAIVLGSLICISVLFSFISLKQACDAVSGIPRESLKEAGFGRTVFASLIGLALRLTLGAIIIKLGIKTMGKPYYYKDTKNGVAYWIYASKGQDIALSVICGILFLVGLLVGKIGGFSIGLGSSAKFTYKINNVLQIVQNVLAISVAALKIVAVVLPKGEATKI